MSDFKEGDLLEHRASGERCIFVRYGLGACTNEKHSATGLGCAVRPNDCNREVKKSVSVVSNGLGGEEILVNTFELTKVKEESK